MKHWLVFYFLLNGVWTPGDIAEPDGWTSIQYDSKEICEERRTFAKDNFLEALDHDLATQIKVVCQPKDPKIFWKRSVRQPLLQATILK